MDEEDIHTYNGILLSHKKDECLPFATTWIEPEGIRLSEISQTEKDEYHRISKKKNANKTNTTTENRLAITKGKGVGKGKTGDRSNWIVMARN